MQQAAKDVREVLLEETDQTLRTQAKLCLVHEYGARCHGQR